MMYIAGITIALFVAALLLNKKKSSKADIILFIWMLLLACHLYLFYINFTTTPFQLPHLLGFEIPLPLIHGVMLYFYVASVTKQLSTKSWVVLLHFLPLIFGYLYLVPFFNQSPVEKIKTYREGFTTYQTFMSLGLLLIFISGSFYVLWSSLLLLKHKKNIKNQFSDIEKVNLRWLQLLTYGMGAVWCIVITTNNDNYIFLGVTFFVILIGFFGVQQKSVFSTSLETTSIPSSSQIQTAEKKKYATSGLREDAVQMLYEELLHFVKEKEYYKKNLLSLNDLAADLSIHPNYLSQIINEKENQSFYDFINTYRVKEFKRLLKDPENAQYTLLGLAYECGFNSKSSFNRYFKKTTGITPSQYAKTLKDSKR